VKPLPSRMTRLDNGVRVVTARLPHLSSPHIVATMRSGPLCEDDETWGMSHLLEHMIFRGTRKHRSARAVSLAADDFGGEIGGTTYGDRVVYDTRTDAGREGDALGLLSEMIASPRFQGLEVEKDVLREELLEVFNDDGDEICPDNLSSREVFAGHPLARSIEGTLEGLEDVTQDAVVRFHKESYGPEHLVIAAAGPVSHRAFTAAVRETFGRLRAGAGPRSGTAPAPPRKRKRRALVVHDDASQTQVRLAFPCGGLNASSRWSLGVLARVLDDGPAARFPAKLIDEEGLAYSLWVDTDLYKERGSIEVGAQVAHDRVGDLVEAVCRELSAIAHKAPTPTEVARVHRRLERDLLDMRDDPCQVAEMVARAELEDLPREPAVALERAQAVKGAAVRRAAAEVFRADNAKLVLVGLVPKKHARRAEAAVARLGA